ncbi:MAG: nuclear transport factor 2 family protein [Novosphingobium sp.]
MSTEANKQTVLKACKCINDRDFEGLLACIHDEGSWSVPYRTDRFPFAGFRDKAAFGEMLAGILGGFSEFSFEVTGITAEGDRVAVEAKSQGVGPGTATYQNVYNTTFEMKDGLIHTAREFFDPFEVLAYVEQLPPQA